MADEPTKPEDDEDGDPLDNARKESQQDDRLTFGGLHITYSPKTGLRRPSFDPILGDPDVEAGDQAQDAASNEIEAAENYGGVPGEKTSENEEDIHEE